MIRKRMLPAGIGGFDGADIQRSLRAGRRCRSQADKIFRAMTSYVSGLKQFSAQTETTLEVVTTDGQKIQFTAPSSIAVSRPDKLYAERRGDIVSQKFYYDGKSLTLYNPDTKYYASVPAPGNLDAMIEFARTKLDVIAPGTDLIDTRAYQLLMQDVTAGTYLGLAVVSGQRCHHLAFAAPRLIGSFGSAKESPGSVQVRDHLQDCRRRAAVQHQHLEMGLGAQACRGQVPFRSPGRRKSGGIPAPDPSAISHEEPKHENLCTHARRRIDAAAPGR